jgi:peroxiredoxin
MFRSRLAGWLILAFVAAAVSLPSQAGDEKKGVKYNQKIKIGQAAPVYRDLPGVDGKKHSLADLSAKPIVVIVITCNHCPVANSYENRLIEFAKKYTTASDSKVALVAISVNNGEPDRLPKMVERAQKKGYNFPYLHDASQKIARDYGAAVTPEFFVLNQERKIEYTGAMDDDLRVSKVTTHYLDDAVQALLKGQKPFVTMTPRVGCAVEYDQ